MATTSCKRCLTPDLHWMQLLRPNGSMGWSLRTASGDPHHCETDTLKTVKCKYCPADDLHWAEEIGPGGKKRGVLTESYGLPHACDERLAFVAKEKQDKKDKYAAIKERVANTPDGPCPKCRGTKTTPPTDPVPYGKTCDFCDGWITFNERNRKQILNGVRNKIWPHLNKLPWGRDNLPF